MSKIYGRCGTNAGKLAYLLGCSVEFPYKNENRYKAWGQNKTRDFKLPIPINLGCKPEFIPPNSLNYNSIKAGDKLYVFNCLDKAGIPHPKVINPLTYKDGPYLGRDNFKSKGRGISFYTTGSIPKDEHDFYVEYIKVKAEYRVHVFMGKVIIECNKKLAPKGFIHTSPNGAKLEIGYINDPERDQIIHWAIKAISAVGLDFGAVDVLTSFYNNQPYVLEVNSDPAMAGVMGYIYAEQINHVLGLERKFDWYIDHNLEVVYLDKDKRMAIKKQVNNYLKFKHFWIKY